MKISKRGRIDPFIVMDVMREANALDAAGGDVVHLEVGQPGTPAPKKVRDVAVAALESNRLGYTDALGIPTLRQAIAAHYAGFYGVSVEPGTGRSDHRVFRCVPSRVPVGLRCG